MATRSTMNDMPTFALNKHARFEYDILETFEAGLVLSGAEVKAIRGGQITLKGSFVVPHGTGLRLTNAHIPRYKHSAPDSSYDPTRSRTLLLHKNEIDKIRGRLAEKGLTAVPLAVYSKGRRIKIEIGIAKGKKLYDKRHSIKEREAKRETDRLLKSRG